MGYSVSHTQKPLDEYNFLVTNLAVDLRDGVRLARLVELHTKDFTILQVCPVHFDPLIFYTDLEISGPVTSSKIKKYGSDIQTVGKRRNFY